MTSTEFAHLLIINAYLVLAVLATRFRLGSRRDTWMARAGGLLFFLGCAGTHIEISLHLASELPLDAEGAHHSIPIVLQAVGAPLFLFAITPYLRSVLVRRDGG